jgi:hypothetical protein
LLRPRTAVGAWIPTDEVRIFWFIQTYRDLSRLRRTLARLRKLYSESQVLVVSDGDPDPEIEQVCKRYSARFALRSRLFGVEQGGEPVQKMLEAFLTTDADILIKIDPDTNIRRRFSFMPTPTDSSLYGTVQSIGTESNRIFSIQGGCIIIPRQAAVLLVSSSLLKSERLKPPALEWALNKLTIDRAASGLTSHDWTLGWACRELGLLCKDHREVYSNYRPRLIDTMRKHRAAVSHPRFEIKQLTNPVFYQWFGPLRRAASKVLGAGRDR